MISQTDLSELRREVTPSSKQAGEKLNFEYIDLLGLAATIAFLIFVEIWRVKKKKKVADEDYSPGLKDIPGPWPALPVLGTQWAFSRFGPYDLRKMHEAYRDMFDKYGPIVKEKTFWNLPMVSLFDIDDIEKIFKYPTKNPIRPYNEIVVAYRNSRPEKFDSVGLVEENGENWGFLRNHLTTEIASRQTVQGLLPEVNNLADDLARFLRTVRGSNDKVCDMLEVCSKVGLENATLLVLGRRLGFLEEKVSPKAEAVAWAMKNHFITCSEAFFGLPFWKLFPTKLYKDFERSEDILHDIISAMVDEALEDENETANTDPVQAVFMSLMKVPELTLKARKAAVIDFIAAGVQTVGNTLVFILYLMATHPECQEKLYEELSTLAPKGYPISAEVLADAHYLKACITEAYRVLPAAPMISRVTESDMVLNKYQVPAGTVVLCHTWLASMQEKTFHNAKVFNPDRWLNDKQKTSIFLPCAYGVGKRVCPGKRSMDQFLPVVLGRLIQEFKIEFEGELELQFEFIMSCKGPVDFIFKDREL